MLQTNISIQTVQCRLKLHYSLLLSSRRIAFQRLRFSAEEDLAIAKFLDIKQ